MRCERNRRATLGLFTGAILTVSTALALDLQVTAVSPPRNTVVAPVASPVSITFDRAVQPASIDASSFRVFGHGSGQASGNFGFSNGNRTVTFTRSRPFSAGEFVSVNLSHDIEAVDQSSLRAAGYSYSFVVRTAAATLAFAQIDAMDNRTKGAQTRIYGASASDLDSDGYLDLTTVNEVSADVRVFMNRADGTGLYHPFLTPQAIGVEASPNEPVDFNNDGHPDLCIAAVESHSVWVLLGVGDGSFSPITEIPVGNFPHGVAVLDVDGDGDSDFLNSNNGSNNLSLHVNDGTGVFAAPVNLEGGVNGEYGLAAGDMNGDGIGDVVVGGRDGQQISTLLGNGNGTFTLAGPAQSAGGRTWVVALGDLDADGDLDAAVANSTNNNGAILLNHGDGTFAAPVIAITGAHTVASDLGDLDGDGDLDWVLSSFGGGFWRLYANNGAGSMAFHQDLSAPANPSCAVLLDFDNDRDLDLALSDEIADVVTLWKNTSTPTDAPVALGMRTLALMPNAPDPFRHETAIRFRLAQPGDVTVSVFDGAGRQVAVRHLGNRPAGWSAWRFDGRSPEGSPLSQGVYYYRVQSAGETRSERMILLH